MHFSPYSILPLTAGIVTFVLGLAVYLNSPSNNVNRIFSGMCVAFFGWLCGYAMAYSTTSAEIGLLSCKFAAAMVCFTAVFPYHLCILLRPQLKNDRIIIPFVYLIATILACLVLFTNYLIKGIHQYFFGFYGNAGPYYWIVIFFCLGAVCRFLQIAYQSAKDETLTEYQKLQAKYFLLSIGTAAFCCIDFFPKYGIEIYPLGSIFAILSMSLLAYAILKHHLLGISFVIKTSLVYSALVGAITAFYLLLVIGAEKLFQGLVGYKSLLLNLAAIFIIAILFNPLRDWIQRFLDRKFFQGTLESLANERQRLQQELFHKEKLAYVGQLASSVVHEIRNPLTALKTYIEYLPQKYNDPQYREKFQSLLPKELDRIEKVVHSLLDLARPRQPLFRPTDINELLTSTLALLEENLKLKRINVKTKFECAEPVTADEEQLKQAFLNIFLNAIQAMSEGGSLTVATSVYGLQCTAYSQETKNIAKNSPATVSSKPYTVNGKPHTATSPTLVVEIADTGHGMPPEQLQKLFTPFQTTKPEGIGLGLIITQEIIHLHSGKISAESMVGEGTRFFVELPVKADYRR